MPRKSVTENPIVVSTGAAAAAPARRKASSKRTAHSVEVTKVTESSVVAEPSAVTVAEPAYEEIAKLAYSYWGARGCTGGSPEEDWLRAEQELRVR
jgi:hypothetical protein